MLVQLERRILFACALSVSLLGCSSKEENKGSTGSYPTLPESAVKGVARTNLDSPTPTKAQLDRKERSRKVIATMNLPWLETLPVVEDDESVRPRAKDEVVGRALATEFCAVRSEGRDQAVALDLVKQYGIESKLSPNERTFLQAASPPKQDNVNFSWGYEHVHVFLWALGYLPELNAPSSIAEVAKEAALIREKGPTDFAAGARLRPMSEILDQNDLYYRIHWAVTELRLKGESSERANEEIVSERHRALNWLIRYMNQDWDDVTTDT